MTEAQPTPSIAERLLQDHFKLDEERYYRDVGKEMMQHRSYQAAYEDLAHRYSELEAQRDTLAAQVRDLQAHIRTIQASPTGKGNGTPQKGRGDSTAAPVPA